MEEDEYEFLLQFSLEYKKKTAGNIFGGI